MLLLVITAASILAFSDRYSVETRLTYVSDSKMPMDFALEKEVELLKNPGIAMAIAHDHRESPECFSPSHRWDVEATAALESELDSEFLKKFPSSYEFAKWVSEQLEISLNGNPRLGAVHLKLTGNDPEMLKQVLNTYVRKYAEFRQNQDEEAQQTKNVSANLSDQSAASQTMIEEIEKLDFEHRECELALKLIDSRKGAFSGFVHGSRLSSLPSLANFQQKITELEIQKRSLSVKFMPHSREMKDIELELQGVKSAMKECLLEHIHYLHTGREMLLAKKSESDRRAVISDKPNKSRCSMQLSNGDKYYPLKSGLNLVQEKPKIAKKPVALRAEEFKDSLSAYLLLPFGKSSSLPNSLEGAENFWGENDMNTVASTEYKVSKTTFVSSR
jgi:hypothetical protein